MHHTDQTPHHIPHSITLTNNKPIEAPLRAKTRIEAPRLRDAVASDQRLADHEDFIWVGEIGEFFEVRHEAGVVVATAGGVDEDDVEVVRGCVGDGVFGDIGCVLTVSFFI